MPSAGNSIDLFFDRKRRSANPSRARTQRLRLRPVRHNVMGKDGRLVYAVRFQRRSRSRSKAKVFRRPRSRRYDRVPRDHGIGPARKENVRLRQVVSETRTPSQGAPPGMRKLRCRFRAPAQDFSQSLVDRRRRGVQDRLPVDQLPFFIVGRVSVKAKYSSTVIGPVLIVGTPTGTRSRAQPLTRIGPAPCGRSPSLMMPSRLATSV